MGWHPELSEGTRPRRLLQAGVPVSLCPTLAGHADSRGIARADITLAGETVAAIDPAAPDDGYNGVDLDGGLVLPAFADVHTHLDKGHIWPRTDNPDGTFAAALDAAGADRDAHWTREDMRRRMEFGLRSAEAHGTRLIRTHLDSQLHQAPVTWPLFSEIRETWRGRIELQGVSLIGIDELPEGRELEDYVRLIADHGGILGAAAYPMPDIDSRLTRLVDAAARYGLDLDLHVDESGDPGADCLARLARIALDVGFAGQIVAGHCCSLAVQPEAEALTTLDLVARAGISVVTLPLCNLYLQDRQPGRTPRWRGVTLVHEMAERDIDVAIASDNTRDPFYAYGDLDMLEVFRAATRILHLDHPFGDWPAAVTRTPAEIMGLPGFGSLTPGARADLVITRARSFSELLARGQSDRVVMRGGETIARSVPDYRELDDVVGG
ncbi:cytosine deaminase [Amorphus orientalis]|uniref:Cytosine deaminase n=1 Tax=Amorphus orientalis TaxID=649198 RepID=A0AAE4AQB8_9HYPH|nr:cytosine deaminase [Amorphus orientalis]MDQ0313901.1 cytosine deaminase [Amorphus orientalis]